MRDIDRIDRICDKLKEAWKIVPDQRLGQFIFNYITSEALLFYYEDDKKITILSARWMYKQKGIRIYKNTG